MARVTFLPGLPLPGAMFARQRDLLASEHEVSLLDYPGFAGREVNGGLSLEQYADDVRSQLGDEPTVLVGVSFGAQLALILASRERKLVSGLVLSSTQGTSPGEQERGMFNGIAEAAGAHGPDAIVDTVIEMLLSEQTRAQSPEVVEQVREMALEATPEGLASAFHALAGRPEPAELLASVSAPALVLYGTDDKLVPPAEGQALADALGGARLELIVAAGHFPSLEQPDTYNAAVSAFLEELHRD